MEREDVVKGFDVFCVDISISVCSYYLKCKQFIVTYSIDKIYLINFSRFLNDKKIMMKIQQKLRQQMTKM